MERLRKSKRTFFFFNCTVKKKITTKSSNSQTTQMCSSTSRPTRYLHPRLPPFSVHNDRFGNWPLGSSGFFEAFDVPQKAFCLQPLFFFFFSSEIWDWEKKSKLAKRGHIARRTETKDKKKQEKRIDLRKNKKKCTKVWSRSWRQSVFRPWSFGSSWSTRVSKNSSLMFPGKSFSSPCTSCCCRGWCSLSIFPGKE